VLADVTQVYENLARRVAEHLGDRALAEIEAL
jgi:hypothetical protein